MTRRLFLAVSLVLCSALVADAAPRFEITSIGGAALAEKVRILKGAYITGIQLKDNDGGELFKANSAATDKVTQAQDELLVGKVAKAKIEYVEKAKDVGQFGATVGKTADLKVSFGQIGSFNNFSTGGFNAGSDATIGKAYLLKQVTATSPVHYASAMLSYNVNVLEQRKVKLGKIKLGNVLKGTNVLLNGTTAADAVQIQTTNKVRDSATYISVAAGGHEVIDTKTTVASGLTLEGTTINDAGEFHYMTLSGQLLSDYNAKYKAVDATVEIASAEDESVGDYIGLNPTDGRKAKAYKPVKFQVEANVGVSTKTWKKATALNDFGPDDKTQIFRGFRDEGETLAGLSSRVSEKGSLAEVAPAGKAPKDGNVLPSAVLHTTFAQNDKGKWIMSTDGSDRTKPNLKNLFGLVGSEAMIVASTGLEERTDVSMQWRMRTANESNNRSKAKPWTGLAVNPSAPKWLTSDVVKIAGIGDDVTYALQMTFDNRINLAFDGQEKGAIENEWQDMWIGQLNTGDPETTTDDVWERAAAGMGHFEDYASLDDFLEANTDEVTGAIDWDAINGHWGVDAEHSKSWAIVKGGGSGIFAVVPEPATVIMMLSATMGAMVYGWRRLSRKNEVVA